jgi:dimethylhistidine N-methyltransferase
MSRSLSTTIQLTDLEPSAADFRAEVIRGLRRRPRRLPCKFFYDERGSQLFDQICELPEYYPTRTELAILDEYAGEIAAVCGERARLVELGSGSSRKTRLLLDALVEPAAYVPIDISRVHLLEATASLAQWYPNLPILPVCADYAQPLRLPRPEEHFNRTTVYFPGSTIGNFEPLEARDFLRHIGTWCARGDRLLVGIDLDKPSSILEPAYNDAQGVTAAFNLNLLRRANDELGATFQLRQFRHEAIYDRRRGRIEMHLVSLAPQRVELAGEMYAFAAGERIITEYSYKYRLPQFVQLARAAGWSMLKHWTDDQQWFGIVALEWTR